MILQQRDQYTGRSDGGIVQGVAKLRLAIGIPVSDVRTAKIQQIGGGVSLTVHLAAWHPGLNILLFVGFLRHVAGEYGHDAIRKL